jgi:hypothetical protein
MKQLTEFLALDVIKKSTPCQHSKGMKRNGGTAPFIFYLDTNQLHVWPLYYLGQSYWYPLYERTAGSPGLNWMVWRTANSLTPDRNRTNIP